MLQPDTAGPATSSIRPVAGLLAGLRRLRYRNRLITNTLVLLLSQLSNYLIPLITVPYIARVLGVEQLGILGMAAGIAANLTTIVDWGFSLSSTQQVAQANPDHARLRTIFWTTMSAKLMLGAVSLVLTIACMAYFGFGSPLSWIILIAWLQVVGSIVNVNFFLQGLETMTSMVLAAFIGRIATVPLIFWLVRTPADTGWALAITGIGGIISGIATIGIAQRTVPLLPPRLTLTGGFQQILDGWHIFLSTSAVNLYTQMNVLIVGAVAGPTAAGLLFGAEKLQRVAKSLCDPLSTAIYPRVNNLLASSREKAVALMIKLLIAQAVIGGFLTATLYFAAGLLTHAFLGADFAAAVPVVKLLALTPLLVGLSTALGIHILLTFGRKRTFMTIVSGAGLFNVLAIGPLSHAYGAPGAALSIVLTECLVVGAMGWAVWRAKLLVPPEASEQDRMAGSTGH